MAQLLLELLCEELPARMQEDACAALRRLVVDGLRAAGFPEPRSRSFVTPRRLALIVDDLPLTAPDRSEQRRGPRDSAPDKAREGFLRANAVSMDQCQWRETPQGRFLFATVVVKGRVAAEVLTAVIEAALTSFPWPKSMRWNGSRRRWARPLRSLLCLFDGAVVPVSFAGLVAGATTCGHRFLSPETVTVADGDDYLAKMRAAHVIIDPQERATIIRAQSEQLAAAEGLEVKNDPETLRETVGLVEWPTVLMGSIDDQFMAVPDEALSLAMVKHQKYFPMLKADGSLAPRFMVVANTTCEDDGACVRVGNERVLRARLADVLFFWSRDRDSTLEQWARGLERRIFHAKLGSEADKVERMRTLAATISSLIDGAPPEMVDRAAVLAKADLSTGMVGAFPELQGIMGRHYALHHNEAPAVAYAIAEHYSPLGPSDLCPSAPVSVCVALADKLDTLVGFWSIDQKPTGSKDPFALRRAASGVVRLIVENGLRLSLRPLLAAHLRLIRTSVGIDGHNHLGDDARVVADLLDFLVDRLKAERDGQRDLINAACATGEDDLVRLLQRVNALAAFLHTDDAANLVAAYRRAVNMMRIEEKKNGVPFGSVVAHELLSQDEERALAIAVGEASRSVTAAIEAEAFEDTMAALARLRVPVDAFFDQVTVNAADADVRANRLRLLSSVAAVMGRVADFSALKGPVAAAPPRDA